LPFIPPKPLTVPISWAPSLTPLSSRTHIPRQPVRGMPYRSLSSIPSSAHSSTPSLAHSCTDPPTQHFVCSSTTLSSTRCCTTQPMLRDDALLQPTPAPAAATPCHPSRRTLSMLSVNVIDRLAEQTFGGSQTQSY
jgi:hypothetical protein